jgi:hypothetical protein
MEDISERRNRLYNTAVAASIIFVIVLATIMVIFKLNEDYFTDNSRFSMLMDTIGMKEVEVSYPKVNIKVNFNDGGDKSLVIPLQTALTADDVNVRDEFTQKKYVISLSGYEQYIAGDIDLVGDLEIMDAAGAYYQNGNVYVEVYCDGDYDYDVVGGDSSVVVNFYEVDSRYDYKAVVWVPFSDRNRLGIPMFEDELTEYARENGIKLYLASELEDEYSQSDLIEYANNIKADMVIGISVENSTDSDSYMTGICNTAYFMPEYDSARLSVNLVEGFASVMNFDVREFEEADTDWPLVYIATVPAAAIKLSVLESAMETDEDMYKLYENIYYGIENTIDNVVSEWRLNDNESR